MPPPRTASEVRDRIEAEARKHGIDRKTVEMVLQSIDQAGFEIRDKGGRDPVPVGDEVSVERMLISGTQDWLVVVDLGADGKIATVDTESNGRIIRGNWAHIPPRLL